MNSFDAVKMFAMGIIITLLVVIVFKDGKTTAADSATAGSLIALTSQAGSGGKTTVMVLVDTSTQHLAMYQMDDNTFGFCTARFYGYDVGIHDLKFSRRGYSVKEAFKFYKADVNVKAGEK